MSEQPAVELARDPLIERFDGRLQADTRPGYSGYVVAPENLLEVVRLLRDELGYDYLSSVSGVDYPAEERLESVVHLYRSTGGPALVLKTRCPREGGSIPSLVTLFPGADFQEREAWDLLGIRYAGHPDLRRILMWEGFAGHPLRKDWKEAYYEEEAKPFKSRWPEGKAVRSEDVVPFGDNVSFPPEYNPADWKAEPEAVITRLQADERPLDDEAIQTDRIVVNLGPQHPSTHGVFRMTVVLDGETIVSLKPVMGYLHRNHEKIAERNTFLQNMPFTDRLDYLSSMSNNFGYALAVEKLMGVNPPERAEYIRVIMAELTRISSHIMTTGFLLNDLGAFFTPALYALEERELVLDIFEIVSGSRMMCNYFRFGGVVRDLPEGVLERIRGLVTNRLPRKIDELDAYLTNNEIVRTRCQGIGVLTDSQAIAYSAGGPILRASGVPYDVRRADPYSIYERFDFDVAVRYHGDVYDRYLVRLQEMRESLKIIQQAVHDIPEGPVMAGKPQYQVRVPAGEAYGRVEGPKGELGFYVVSNGKPNPYRYHVRAPSFINTTGLETMCMHQKVADAVVVLGSIDIILGEVDR